VTGVRLDSADPGYRDPARTVEERVEDLLSRMSREEKAAQLGSAWVFQLADGAEFAVERARELLRLGLGQVTRVSGASSLRAAEAAALTNTIQRHLVEETRLGIPAIVHEEICSGLMAREATIYPQAIGLASTWEPALIEAMADAVRGEMRAMGAQQGLSPVLDVCRDPRWGRLEESFGEDPHLVARMGVAFVRGLQGADLCEGVVATAKHFVGYGASEGGMNWAPVHVGARELREVYLHPFEAAVRVAGVRSVMNAYHELDGMPCGADRDLLTGLLRDEWGFDGCVVADYFSVRQLNEYHRLATTGEEAAAMAINAGLDVELPGTDCYGAPLLAALESGLVGEAQLDTAVRRVLKSKFELGLFERPYVAVADVAAATDTPAHRDLALQLARKSIVLLKNDGVLPLATPSAGSGSDLSTIALIGPNADSDRQLMGDYAYPAHIESLIEMQQAGRNVFSMPLARGVDVSVAGARPATVRDALVERLGDRITLARGCDIGGPSRAGFDEAVALAARSDIAVLVMGDKSGLTDDCTSGEGRDRSSLDLPGVQEELARAVIATGTPVVLVLVAGRPCGSAWLHEHCNAVVAVWLPGQEGAEAIAQALAGESNPGGKLPISHPRSVGQIPVFYGHKISGGRSHWKGDYVDGPSSPLYPFGHGLSYTTFALGAGALQQSKAHWNESIAVDVTVTNTGERAGDEVVQLYIHDPQASLTRPVLELKAFRRVELAAGASCTLTFTVPAGQLGFYDRDLVYVVEPGEIEVFAGTSSTDLVPVGTVTIVADPSGAPAEKAFDGSVTIA
jgi:beta-glucosidase